MPRVFNLSKDRLVVVYEASASGYDRAEIRPGESRAIHGKNLADLGTVVPGLREFMRLGVIHVEWAEPIGEAGA